MQQAIDILQNLKYLLSGHLLKKKKMCQAVLELKDCSPWMCSESSKEPIATFPPVILKAFEIFTRPVASLTVKIHYTYGSSKLLQEAERRGAEDGGLRLCSMGDWRIPPVTSCKDSSMQIKAAVRSYI